METTYRIHQNLLLQINTDKRTIGSIHKHTVTNNDKTTVQYFDKDLLDKVVWYHDKVLNKLWYSDNVIELDNNLISESTNEKLVDITILLQQGFDFSNYYGILLLLKDVRTDFVYCSYLLTPDMFKFTDNREVINGTYWNYKFDTKIPDTLFNETGIAFGAELVKVSQIDEETKTISNYPINLEPLVKEIPFIDKLVISAEWDNNLNLKIEPKSTIENMTTRQVLLNIFSESEIDNIVVQHVVRFPADEYGNYAEYVVSNNVSPLGPIVIGLPLIINGFKHKIDITSYIRVNGKLASRNTSIIWDFATEASSNLRNLIASEQEQSILHTVNVEEKITIENNIVDVVNNYKTITVPVPTFIELVNNKTITLDNKLISLPELTSVDVENIENIYLKVYFKPEENSSENIIILAQKTIDDKIYFDISEVNSKHKQSELTEIPFKIYSFDNNKLMMSGKFVSNKV